MNSPNSETQDEPGSISTHRVLLAADSVQTTQSPLSLIAVIAWHSRMLLSIALAAGVILGYLLSYLDTPVYRSEALLSIALGDSSGALDSLDNSLGGLVGLAGLGGANTNGKQVEAIATLRSRDFVRSFIVQNELSDVLRQGRDVMTLGRGTFTEPGGSLEDLVGFFVEDVARIVEDGQGNLYRLIVEWHEPEEAARWVSLMIDQANMILRNRAIDEASRGLVFLNEQLDATTTIEQRQAIFRMMEAQLSNIMMAEVSPDYAFRVVDSAVVPELDDRIRPRRSSWALLAALLLFSVTLISLMYRAHSSDSS